MVDFKQVPEMLTNKVVDSRISAVYQLSRKLTWFDGYRITELERNNMKNHWIRRINY